MKRTGPTNYQLQQLLAELERISGDSKFWKRIMVDLRKPSRQRRTVNVYKINKYAKDGETVVVPGKVLNVGDLTKKVDVAALNFSSGAKEKILAAKGRTFSIKELLLNNPDGKNVRILG
ncbi:MAG: 50S ribosomal protein L18e [Nanoarchaeota archaeon]|nr:50S ribosomal protein L18e [Nanoarchaeota archaeon]MBU1644137.1 50S ribosomal protein L18e [Nanoarchaeota archaeon]MBU1976801.1 50S ribosomal protein L18e [Nanoarchaeota archaeon]